MPDIVRQFATIIVRPQTTIIERRSRSHVTAIQVSQGIPGKDGKDGSFANYEILTVQVAGQTNFTLQALAPPQLTLLFVNGLKAGYAKDYLLNGVVITWIGIVRLDPEDFLEILY